MSTSAFILTCETDRRLAHISLAGFAKHWPEMPFRIFMDNDRQTESELPDDVRELCRKIPTLRRVFDFPPLMEADTIHCLDSDCFCFSHPDEFGPQAYQGVILGSGKTDQEAIEVWKDLGYEINDTPCFCAGMFSIPRKVILDSYDLAIEYVRLCKNKQYHLHKSKAWTILEQGLWAGLWRMNCEENPLPWERYPYITQTESQVIYHAGYAKTRPEFEDFLTKYKNSLN